MSNLRDPLYTLQIFHLSFIQCRQHLLINFFPMIIYHIKSSLLYQSMKDKFYSNLFYVLGIQSRELYYDGLFFFDGHFKSIRLVVNQLRAHSLKKIVQILFLNLLNLVQETMLQYSNYKHSREFILLSNVITIVNNFWNT